MKQGIGASFGIGIGKAYLIRPPKLNYARKLTDAPQDEWERLRKAIAAYCEQTRRRAERMKQDIGPEEAEILSGHIMMIQDPDLTEEILHYILEEHFCAEAALEDACNHFINLLYAAEDELTVQRAADVKDVKTGVLSILLGVEQPDISELPSDAILITHELTPSMTVGIHRKGVAGIVTETGGTTSHAAILARALRIPAVLGVRHALSEAENKMAVVIDGDEGTVVFDPSDEEITAYRQKKEQLRRERHDLRRFVGQESRTADGHKMSLLCNIGQSSEADSAVEADGEGIGLLRTEFLFMEALKLPGEEEQYEAYRYVMQTMKGKPVTIRTLDIGGDKFVPALDIPQKSNPFLGFRAIRYCLDRESLFRTQLRAILRASVEGDLRIMVPLVTCAEEMRQVRLILEQEKRKLAKQGIPYRKDIPLGAMIETPAAAMIVDILCYDADFFSVGTNDLVQYTMAVDRGNPNVAYLYSHYQPSVLRVLQHILASAHQHGIPVAICGEAAADPLMIPFFIASRLDEFSVNPSSVLPLRKSISKWTLKEAMDATGDLLRLETEAEVHNYLKQIRR